MSASTIRRLSSLLIPILVLCGCGSAPPPKEAVRGAYVPHPNATWPWPGAVREVLRKGVTHWFTDQTVDGTTLDLIEFDFDKNSKLSLELYSQDEDDAKPWDNSADYYERGVGAIVRHLHDVKRGTVVAAWNGPFFAYGTPGGGPGVTAHPIGPVVIRGKGHANVGNHRWTFGVSAAGDMPKFSGKYLMPLKDAERTFDYSAAGVQMLVRARKPLHIGGQDSEDSAGTIDLVDVMRTSRVSMGWSEDSSKFYLLFVNEPDTENASKIQVKRGQPSTGGWALRDLQRFWLSFGVWSAVNSDGGSVAQMTYLRRDGKYELLPPRLLVARGRLVFARDFEGAPEGGTLMTWYVTER